MNRALLATLIAASLAACETVPDPEPQRPGPVTERPPIIEPVDPTGTDPEEVEPEEVVEIDPVDPDPVFEDDSARLALLLPFSSENPRLREEAASMLRAVELALFARPTDDVEITLHDTRGTESGAREAARAASGADVILGPILAGEVSEVSRIARRDDIPVLAFSTDTGVAGRGTYLLSFPPEAEVERIVRYAAGTGIDRFAILHSDNAYGRRVAGAYRDAVRRNGGEVTASESYSGSTIEAMQGPAERLATAFGDNPATAPFQAVLLPEGGTALRSLAPLMTFYNPRAAQVQLLGTALWLREDTAREPALGGGLFAAADRTASDTFTRAFRNQFGTAPSRLASQAYDAVGLGALIATGDPDRREFRAENPEGFYGADGFIRLRSDGTPERGLAIYEVANGTYRIVDPAPTGAIGSN